MVPTAEMGVQAMNKQSENKVTKTDTTDKSKRPSAAPTKDELSEQELEKASAGFGFGGHFGGGYANIGSQGTGSGTGK